MTKPSIAPKKPGSPAAEDADDVLSERLRDARDRLAAAGLSPAADPVRGREAAEYIAQMSVELAALARAANLGALAYFLDMAHLEAATLAHSGDAAAS